MAINKVDLIDGTVLVDMTDATATADKILSPYTAYGADGTKMTGNIANKTSTDLTASGATVTVPAGYYSTQATKSVASGTEGTPTATKGTVSNNSVSVTPSVTNSAGYIAGGTKTGTAVTVSASELVSGTKTIADNGEGIDVTNYASVDVNVKQKFTATISRSDGGDTNPRVQVNGTGTIYHNDGDTFTFSEGDYLYFYVGTLDYSNSVFVNGDLVWGSTGYYTYYPTSDVSIVFYRDDNDSIVRITTPTISITTDGKYDVTDYAVASVDIQPKKTSEDVTLAHVPNLLNSEILILSAYIGLSGGINSSNTDRIAILEVEPNTTYTWNWNRVTISGNDDSNVSIFESEPSIGSKGRLAQSSFLTESGSITFTTSSTETWVAIKVAQVLNTDLEATLSSSSLYIGPGNDIYASIPYGYYSNDVEVAIPLLPGYIKPKGSQSITTDGVYDVTSYSQVEVAVSPDWTEATAEAEDVLHGKTFYGSDGFLTTGIASSLTGQVYQDEDGYIVLDDDGSYKGDRWTRPSEWMPYAKGWSKSSFEGIYYVYDLALNVDEDNPAFWALFMSTTVNGGKATIETGYVNTNGVFIAETSEVWTSGTGKEGLLPYWDEINSYERYFVVRVTPQDGYHLSFVNFNTPSANLFSELYGTISLNNDVIATQPCIEQYGRLPYISMVSRNYGYRHNHTISMKHSYLIDVGKGGNLTAVNQAFRYSRNLECVDGLETWDVSNVTTFENMFGSCDSLLYITGLQNWDMGEATTISNMFSGCYSLKAVDKLSGKSLENVTSIQAMFDSCYSLEEVDFSNISFSSKLTNMTNLFRSCDSLKNINLSNVAVSPTTINGAFQDCHCLKTVDISGIDLSIATNMSYIFSNCYSLQRVVFGAAPTNILTTIQNIFNNTYHIRALDFTDWNFSSITNANGFQNMLTLVSLKGLSVPVSFNISANTMLNTDALVEILTALPTVATAQTITLGNTLKGRLSAEQLAIATEKGWTVA